MFDITPTPVAAQATVKPETPLVEMLTALVNAAAFYGKKGDGYKKQVCLDMAHKLGRYRSFASDKQRAYAESLVAGAKATAAPAVPALTVPDLHAVLQRHAKFYAERLTITRKNDDSLCWLLWDGACVGKIDRDASVTVWASKLADKRDRDNIEGLLREFEANPLGAAIKYGKLSGRCCSCGRELTNEDSIEAGIGPVCAEKFGI